MLRTQTPIFPSSLEMSIKRKSRSPPRRINTPTSHKRSLSRNSRTHCPRSKSIDRSRLTPHRELKARVFSQEHEALLEKGKKLLSRQSFREAIDCFSTLIKLERNLEGLYSRAVCYMHLNEHKQALPDLLIVAQENPLFDKHLYVAMSMCFVAGKDIQAAVRHISKGLHRFPRFAEGYLIRGRLYNQQQAWEKAISDFRKCISISPKEGGAFIGMADSLIGIGDPKTALKVLEQALTYPETKFSALLKRAKLYISLEKHDKALEDLDEYLLQNTEDPEAYYLKSLILIEIKMFNEAVLSLEQVIKFDSENSYIGDSVFHIGAIKIRERDFYGALHTFKRAPLHLQIKDQLILSAYAEAVINLMKRKYKEGVAGFSKLIRRNYSVIKEYIGNCYAFRGYGYTALGKHEKALRDYKSAIQLNSLDKASKFNQTLSKGLVYLSKKEKEKALGSFARALRQFPRNPDPLLYHAAVLLERRESYSEAESLLSKAVRLRDSECEVYFFRSVLRYLMGKGSEALEDVKQAIEKAEDNMPEHYLIRGLCQTLLKDYQEAMQDFSIVIQLKDTMKDAYFFRVKCAYLLDDTNIAFSDVQKLIELSPSDPEILIFAGNMYMLAGSYDEALAAYTGANKLKVTSEGYLMRAKTYILTGNMESAVSEIAKALSVKSNPSLNTDKEILELLIKVSKDRDYQGAYQKISQPGEIFEEKHIRWFKGAMLMYMKKYIQAIAEFQRVLEIIHAFDPAQMNSDEALTAEEENCEILYNIAICHMNSNKQHALLILQDLAEVLNSKHRGQMLFISALIDNNNPDTESLFKEALECDPESISPYFRGEQTTLLPLNTSNEFSSRFELINLPIELKTNVMVRPAISLPRIRPAGFDFKIEDKAREYFTTKKITPKPEAPWLNRVKGSIQFTENMFEMESEASEVTVEKRESEEEKPEDKREVKSAVALRHYSSVSLENSHD